MVNLTFLNLKYTKQDISADFATNMVWKGDKKRKRKEVLCAKRDSHYETLKGQSHEKVFSNYPLKLQIRSKLKFVFKF
jgi:hypothetical protein